MTAAIGWAIYGWATAGQWLIVPAGLATTYALYRATTRLHRRATARRTAREAHYAALIAEARARDTAAIRRDNDRRPGTDTNALTTCEAIWQLTPRKETS